MGELGQVLDLEGWAGSAEVAQQRKEAGEVIYRSRVLGLRGWRRRPRLLDVVVDLQWADFRLVVDWEGRSRHGPHPWVRHEEELRSSARRR